MNELIAICTRDQATYLVDYDHHRVRVDGRLAVMLTYDWMPLENAPDPLLLRVVFQYAEKHPAAPPDIQAIIDQLHFMTLEETP